MNISDALRLQDQETITVIDETTPGTKYVGSKTKSAGTSDKTMPCWKIKRILTVGSNQIVDYPVNTNGEYITSYSLAREDRASLTWLSDTIYF